MKGPGAAKKEGYGNAFLSKLPHISRWISLIPTGVDHRESGGSWSLQPPRCDICKLKTQACLYPQTWVS